jgi:hypothetical protein
MVSHDRFESSLYVWDAYLRISQYVDEYTCGTFIF